MLIPGNFDIIRNHIFYNFGTTSGIINLKRTGLLSAYEKIMIQNVLETYISNNKINLENICRSENIILKEMPDIDFDNALGQFVLQGSDGNPTIYLNTKQPVKNQWYCIARQLGHYFLDHGSVERETQKIIQENKRYNDKSAHRFALAILKEC